LRPCHADETNVSDDRVDEEGGVRMSGTNALAMSIGVLGAVAVLLTGVVVLVPVRAVIIAWAG
jgi:hypothetical protein